MVATFSVQIEAHRETRLDGTIIDWPAAVISNVHPGDYILGNISTDTTFTGDSWDQSTSITVTVNDPCPDPDLVTGISAPSVTGGGTNTFNGIAYGFNGPYCAIPHQVIDLQDDDFDRLEIVVHIEDQFDPYSAQWKVKPHSGPINLYGDEVIPGAIGLFHQTSSHMARGHFTGAPFEVAWLAANAFFATPPSGSENLYFVTDDGSGDGIHKGQYRIAGPIAGGPVPNSGGAVGKQLIAAPGTTFLAGEVAGSVFPSPLAGSVVTFQRMFPAPVPSVSTGASNGPFYIRYCYTKVWSDALLGQRAIESALSPIVYSGGASGGIPIGSEGVAGTPVTFTIPPAPYGYSGFNVYASAYRDDECYQYPTTPPTGAGAQNYTFTGDAVNGWTVTLTSVESDHTFTIGRQRPSFGFYAWTPGTSVTGPGMEDCMKLGFVAPSADSKGAYAFHHYHPQASKSTTSSHGYKSVEYTHLNTSLATGAKPTDGSALTYNLAADRLTFSAAGAGGSAANPMTHTGDMLYGGASGALSRLPYSGDPGTIWGGGLLYSGTAPAWADPGTNGGLVYSTGRNTAPAFANPGGTNAGIPYLTAPGAVPSWATIPGAGTVLVATGSTALAFQSYLALASSAHPALSGTGTGQNGIVGTSDTQVGVAGTSTSGMGLYGSSSSAYGVYGTTATGLAGVYGINTGTSLTTSMGVYGESASGAGVYGDTNTGWALAANVQSTGSRALYMQRNGVFLGMVDYAGWMTLGPAFDSVTGHAPSGITAGDLAVARDGSNGAIYFDTSGSRYIQNDGTNFVFAGRGLSFPDVPTTTSATGGSATYNATTNPIGFMTVVIHGSAVKIPYYSP